LPVHGHDDDRAEPLGLEQQRASASPYY